MNIPPDSTTDVSRALSTLVHSRLLSRAGADRVTRLLRAELTCTSSDVTALVTILDALVYIVDSNRAPDATRANSAEGNVALHLEGMLTPLRELKVFEVVTLAAARHALHFAAASIPEAGVVATASRAFFPGVGRRRCIVLTLGKVRAHLQQKKAVSPR